MTVIPERSAGKVEHNGTTYYFCCRSCEQKFRKDPARYLAPPPPELVQINLGLGPSAAVPDSTACCSGENSTSSSTTLVDSATHSGMKVEYICPMDPEVLAETPGACPICGMALEPRAIRLEDGPNPELVEMTRRFWAAAALGAPVFVVAMADMFFPAHGLHRYANLINWIQLVLSTVVVFGCGQPFFVRAWNSVKSASPNMFTLISLGVGAAFAYSLVATVAPGIFPAGFREHGEAVMPYFDTATTVIVLVLLGQVLELKARGRTSAAIRALLRLAPKTTRRIEPNGDEIDVAIESICVGDQLRVRPGESIAADGTVVDGNSTVDESMMSGESLPVDKSVGSSVMAGSMNKSGTLIYRADQVGVETTLSRIVRMVSDAQRTHAPVERIVDRISKFFVPAVVAVSLLTFIAWGTWGSEAPLIQGLIHAVAVLIIACPCALGLATPMAVMVGIGRGAEEGILFRSAEALETLERADVLIVDKTGTLTAGRPALRSIVPASGIEPDELLQVAASLERSSQHPIATSILELAREKKLALLEASDFESISGRGISAIIGGSRYRLGSPTWLVEMACDLGESAAKIIAHQQNGETVVALTRDCAFIGWISVADSVKPTSREAVHGLQQAGLKIVMATGDNQATANAVARELRVDEVYAEMRPAEKLELVKKLQSQGLVVAMAGDGVNDAPALAQAQIGIAMGQGTDAAIESAGVTLVNGDLRSIIRARRLSQATVRNIRQNLALAFIYNLASIPIAAGVLYPLTGLLISPVWASVAMSASSISVVSNALRLRAARL